VIIEVTPTAYPIMKRAMRNSPKLSAIPVAMANNPKRESVPHKDWFSNRTDLLDTQQLRLQRRTN